jgi:hypothetical protein
MFDSSDAFTRQFTPTAGGYLYYPSARAGGKLVTPEECERLVRDWQHVAGRRGRWKTAGLVLGAVLLWTVASEALALPEWTGWLMIAGCVAFISASYFWASFAPRRLVRDRPDIAPPRPLSEAGREVRAMVNWRVIAFALLLSGAALFATLSSPERSAGWWAWLIGSGALFASYVWIAVRKVLDRQG